MAWTFILSLLAGSAKKYSNDNPEHETYCVIGTEEGCVLPEEELFPLAFDDFDDKYIGDSTEELVVPDFESSSVTKEESKDVVLK